MKSFKKTLEAIKFGIISGLTMLGFLLLGFYLVNARTSNYGGLESQAGDKITSAKRNALVKKTSRIDVSTSDTAVFDINCERRFFDPYTKYVGAIKPDGSEISIVRSFAGNAFQRLVIKYNDKGNTYGRAPATSTYSSAPQSIVSKLQKRCQN